MSTMSSRQLKDTIANIAGINNVIQVNDFL